LSKVISTDADGGAVGAEQDRAFFAGGDAGVGHYGWQLGDVELAIVVIADCYGGAVGAQQHRVTGTGGHLGVGGPGR
jgi:hypothetical protein